MSETELAPRRAARRLVQPKAEPAVSPKISIADRRVNPSKASIQSIKTQAPTPALDRVELASVSFDSVFARAFARLAVWFGETTWLATGDQAKATVLRLVSHTVILVVVISIAFIAGRAQAQPAETNTPAAKKLQPIENQENYIGAGGPIFYDQLTVAPIANPFTIVPNRPRKDTIIYTVQPNDILSQIAVFYSLRVETILWANTDVLNDDPHNLTPGMSLKIPPVDGILYVVQSGDTVASIAAKYKTTTEAIYTDGALWNNLNPGQQPVIGSALMVPGGSRDFKPPTTTARVFNTGLPDSGFCKNLATGATGTGAFVWPIAQHWISGYRYAAWHPGVDLAAQNGDQVYASDSGTVIYAGWNNSGYGNLIVIDHGNGWTSYYAHNSVLVVSCGQVVAQGQLISAAGSTGRSSGPHLHFEMQLNGVPQYPISLLPIDPTQ